MLSRGQIILSSALLLLAIHNKVTQTLAPCTLPVATGRNRYVLRRQKCDTGVMIVYMAFEHSEWFGWLPLRGPRRGVTTCRPPPSLAPRRRTRNTLNQPVACRAASSLFTSITNSCRFTIVQIVINILTVMIEWKSGIVAGIVQVEAVM